MVYFKEAMHSQPSLPQGAGIFGIRVFEECCSLVQVGAQGDSASQLLLRHKFVRRALRNAVRCGKPALRKLNMTLQT